MPSEVCSAPANFFPPGSNVPSSSRRAYPWSSPTAAPRHPPPRSDGSIREGTLSPPLKLNKTPAPEGVRPPGESDPDPRSGFEPNPAVRLPTPMSSPPVELLRIGSGPHDPSQSAGDAAGNDPVVDASWQRSGTLHRSAQQRRSQSSHCARTHPGSAPASPGASAPTPVNPPSESATPPVTKTSSDTTASSPSSDSGAPRDAYN